MEGRGEQPTLPDRDRVTRAAPGSEGREHRRLWPDRLDPWCSDEDRVERTPRDTGDADVLFEGVHLPPNALRRTVMSTPPSVSVSPDLTGPPSRRSASRIMPAQEPKAGRPAARCARSGSSSPNSRANLIIVVDSPPGSTMPSMSSSSVARRIGRASAPTERSAARCSRTSPCRARTPTRVARVEVLRGRSSSKRRDARSAIRKRRR